MATPTVEAAAVADDEDSVLASMIRTSFATMARGLTCDMHFEQCLYTKQTDPLVIVAQLEEHLRKKALKVDGLHTYSEMFVDLKTDRVYVRFCQNYSIPFMQEVFHVALLDDMDADAIQVDHWLHAIRIIYVRDGTNRICVFVERKATATTSVPAATDDGVAYNPTWPIAKE